MIAQEVEFLEMLEAEARSAGRIDLHGAADAECVRVVAGGACRLNLRNRAFLDDPAPVQADCPCLLCRRFSRAYLAHLFRARELLAYRLATCHNLTFTLDFMVRIRAALRA